MKLIQVAASSLAALSAVSAMPQKNDKAPKNDPCGDLTTNEGMVSCMTTIRDEMEKMSKGKFSGRMESGLKEMVRATMEEKMAEYNDMEMSESYSESESMAHSRPEGEHGMDRPNRPGHGEYGMDRPNRPGMGMMGQQQGGGMYVEGNVIINNGHATYDVDMAGMNGGRDEDRRPGMSGDRPHMGGDRPHMGGNRPGKEMDMEDMYEHMKQKFMDYVECTDNVNMKIHKQIKAKFEEEKEMTESMSMPDFSMQRAGHGDHDEEKEKPNKGNGNKPSKGNGNKPGKGDKPGKGERPNKGDYEKEDMHHGYEEDEHHDMEYDMWAWESIDEFYEKYGEEMMEMMDMASDESKAMWEEHMEMYKEEHREAVQWVMPYVMHMEFKFCIAKPQYEAMMGGDRGHMSGSSPSGSYSGSYSDSYSESLMSPSAMPEEESASMEMSEEMSETV